jgi:hypothetical protein
MAVRVPPLRTPVEQGTRIGGPAELTGCYRASLLIGLLLTVAAGLGLFGYPYQDDTAFAARAFRGTDLISVAVALPVLTAALVLARWGSRRAVLVWLGALASSAARSGSRSWSR